MGHMYTLRILLVMCDVVSVLVGEEVSCNAADRPRSGQDQHQSAIKELTKVSLVNNLTMMVAWTCVECVAVRAHANSRIAPSPARKRREAT